MKQQRYLEPTYKSRGFIKSKVIMSSIGTAKSASSAKSAPSVQDSGKAKPYSSSPYDGLIHLAKQNHAKPQVDKDLFGCINQNVYPCDENVDVRAAKYISYIRERFILNV